MKKKNKPPKRNMPKGEDHPNATLSNKTVVRIRKQYKTGKYTQQDLADQYGLSLQYTNRLINKRVR